MAVVHELFPACETRFEEIPTPDPRAPIRAVPFVAWEYEGTVARPALAAPPNGVRLAISDIAAQRYALDRWSQLAAAASAALMTKAESEHILAAMVHPSTAPPAMTPWDWRFRIQVAAALLLSHHHETQGRSAVGVLADLIDGPVDWTTTAAIVALLDISRRHRSEAYVVAKLLLQLAGRRPMTPIWFCCGAYPALFAVMDVPDLPTSLYEKVERWIQEWALN